MALLIKRRFGLQLSVWTVGRYLKRWGFTPQKPARRAWEQNPEQVRQWLLRKISQEEEKARDILWSDEMGLWSDHAMGRSYGLKGQTPVILAIGQRFGCNMIFAHYQLWALKLHGFQRVFYYPSFLGVSPARAPSE